jgi:hypothetical protein
MGNLPDATYAFGLAKSFPLSAFPKSPGMTRVVLPSPQSMVPSNAFIV